jgi:hypothetical protein
MMGRPLSVAEALFSQDPLSAGGMMPGPESFAPTAIGSVQQQPSASAPYVWASGGRRVTPEQIALEQKMAAAKLQSDYSPVGSIWQGLGRVADNVTGALEMRQARKDAKANAGYDQSIASILAASGTGTGNSSAVARALSDPYVSAGTRQLAMKSWEYQNKPVEPHYWETNNGSLGTIGRDGVPHIAYPDPTPKIQWITSDNGDGTKTIVPMGPNGPLQAQPNAAPAPVQPDWTSAFTPEELGVMHREAQRRQGASGTPSGSPLTAAPNTKIIQGPNGPVQAWNINGEWYDNPEGE